MLTKSTTTTDGDIKGKKGKKKSKTIFRTSQKNKNNKYFS